MANDDPTNELAHLSLGKAYLDAGQAEEAVESLDRTISLNPAISRPTNSPGQRRWRKHQGERKMRSTASTRGVKIADDRGERQFAR